MTQRGDFDRPADVPDTHLRDQIAEALAGIPVRPDTAGALDIQQAEELATVLLPLIEAHVQAAAKQRAAEELREAAREWRRLTDGAEPVARFLRARAAALSQPSPQEGT